MLRASRFTPWIRAVVVLCALALMLILALARAPTAESTPGAESPQAVVDRLNKASENEDLATMASLMEPPLPAFLTLSMISELTIAIASPHLSVEWAAAMAEGGSEEEKAAAEKKRKEITEQLAALATKYEALVVKYELGDILNQEPGPAMEMLMTEVDQVALMRDLARLLDERPGDQPSDFSTLSMPVGELTDLEVEGDRATGMVGDEPVSFVKVDGRWYVDIE